MWGLPKLWEDREPEETPVVIDVVSLEDETNLPDAALPEPVEIEPEPTPEPVMVEPEPEPEPEPERAEPELEPKPEPSAQVTEIVPEPEPAPKAPDFMPKPEAKPKPPLPPDPFVSLLKTVEEVEQTINQREPEETAAEALPPAPQELQVNVSATPQVTDEPLSMTVIDLIRRQVEKNWSVPAGAKDARDMSVALRIQLRPDGSVIDAEYVDTDRLDEAYRRAFRAMAESAKRAVFKASPLQGLPTDKYEKWRDIQFTFRPPA